MLHRDIGFFCIGLTILYAISGVAVNHIKDWNPNYVIKRIPAQIATLPAGTEVDDAVVADILKQLDEKRKLKSYFQNDPETVDIFVEGNTVKANIVTGEVVQERAVPRTFFYPLNFLHLNHPKKMWTWVADIYAVLLLLLAVTGLCMMKGKKQIMGRSGVLTLAGFLVPLLFLMLYM